MLDKNRKPTAIIDKSLLHEVSELPQKERADFWKFLLEKYLVVVPFILLEEIVVNAISPGTVAPQHIEVMSNDVMQLRNFWIDDIAEYAFRELVRKQPITNLIALPADMHQMLSALDFKHPEVLKWAQERKDDRKAVVKRWRELQQKISPQNGFHVVASEKEFYQKVLGEFLKILNNPSAKKEYLETVLGDIFRKRHPEAANEIGNAFDDYGEKSYLLFPVTRICLMLRLVYILAPTVRIQNPINLTGYQILNPRNQINNSADEQYVACSQLCKRLLTMDQGMKNVADIFRVSGVWPGQVILIDPQSSITSQMQSAFV
jgi:hypothetical protein